MTDTDRTDVGNEQDEADYYCEYESSNDKVWICGEPADHVIRPAGWGGALTDPKMIVCSDHMDELVSLSGDWEIDERDPEEYFRQLAERMDDIDMDIDGKEAGPAPNGRPNVIELTAEDFDIETDDGVRSPDETIQWITKPGDEVYGLRLADAGGNLSIEVVDPEGIVRESIILNTDDELDGLIAALEQVADEEGDN